MKLQGVLIEKGNRGNNLYKIDLDNFEDKKQVPVHNQFDHYDQVGSASVYKKNGSLYSDIILDEDFVNKSKNIKLYPAIGGMIKEYEVDNDGNKVVKEFELFSVGLSVYGNADETIPPIKINNKES